MFKKNSLALFLVLVIISSTSYWTPENELLEIREFYSPVEIDNGNEHGHSNTKMMVQVVFLMQLLLAQVLRW